MEEKWYVKFNIWKIVRKYNKVKCKCCYKFFVFEEKLYFSKCIE